MYYPICYVMPNYGPCQQQAEAQIRLQVHSSITTAPTVAQPTTTWDATKAAIESSVSKRKAMLRSIYSSNSAASSRSSVVAVMATATSTKEPKAKQPKEEGDDDEAKDETEDSDSDDMFDVSGMAGYGMGAVIGAIIAVLV